jgi:hypothetical protein
MHSTTETPLHTTPPVNEELLRKFGLRDPIEIETLEAFLHNMLDYGCEPLIRGMTTMFIGMQNAASLWADLKEENRSINAGSVLLSQELDEAKDHSLTETLSMQKAEVGSTHTRSFLLLPTTASSSTDAPSSTGTMQPSHIRLSRSIDRD